MQRKKTRDRVEHRVANSSPLVSYNVQSGSFSKVLLVLASVGPASNAIQVLRSATWPGRVSVVSFLAGRCSERGAVSLFLT